MNPITSIAATLSFILLITSCGTQNFSQPNLQEKLPAEFSDYKYLNEITAFDNYSIEPFKYTSPEQFKPRRPNDIQHSINKTTNNVIIKVITTIDNRTELHNFYKLDVFGNIIDEYQFKRSYLEAENTGNELLVEGVFLVNKERIYYNTWPLDGDKTKKQFIPINKNLAWSDEQVNAFYADILKKSTRLDEFDIYEPISKEENAKRVRKIYYLNSTLKWYVLYGNSLKNNFTVKEIGRYNYNNLFGKDTPSEYYENDSAKIAIPANVTILHFQNLTYKKFKSYGGSKSNGSSSMNYILDGMGYYQVQMDHGILRFKNKESLSHTDFNNKGFPPKESLLKGFAFYTNPKLKYALFSANNVLYLIKQK